MQPLAEGQHWMEAYLAFSISAVGSDPTGTSPVTIQVQGFFPSGINMMEEGWNHDLVQWAMKERRWEGEGDNQNPDQQATKLHK